MGKTEGELNNENEEIKSAQGDEINFEPDEEMGDLVSLQAKLKKIKLELANCKAERGQFLDGWQRAKADSINIRKDAVAEGMRARTRTRDALVHDIIPALDSFDMAKAGSGWQSVEPAWRAGIERVQDLLIDALRRNGIERYGKVGEKYNHELHDALGEEEKGEEEAGTIVRVVRQGYKTADRVLRPAHVFVKKA